MRGKGHREATRWGLGITVVGLCAVFWAALGWAAAWASPPGASEKEEIQALKAQVQALVRRIDRLERKEAEAPAPATRSYWKNGFRFEYGTDKNREYTLRLRSGIQIRYTYSSPEGAVPSSSADFSSFSLRRLHLFADGTAPNRDWLYYVHLQLEPQGAVNTLDGFITWKRYKFARLQFGRMKIPYSLEFWQSGFMQNGVDRTIFSGENEGPFPGGNARLKIGGHLDGVSGFPIGGMLLSRSQGVNLYGYVDMFGRKDVLAYWVGVFNGRDTGGLSNTGDALLYSARMGINVLPGSDPKGPMGPGGFDNYLMQGDYGYNTKPLAALVLGTFNDQHRLDEYFDPTGASGTYGTITSHTHRVENYGFDAALMFRYLGLSCDLESGWEEFIQDPGGSLQQTWDRWAARVNLGYFFVPRKWEGVFKAAYFDRLLDNNLENSLASGLGLVRLRDGYAVEDNLQQYAIGVNYYLHGFNQYISAAALWYRRKFTKIEASAASALAFTGPISAKPGPQNDYGVQVQYQHFF